MYSKANIANNPQLIFDIRAQIQLGRRGNDNGVVLWS